MYLLTHRYAIVAFAITLSMAGLALVRSQLLSAEAALPPQEPLAAAVDVAEVHAHRISDRREYSGRLEAVEHVQIRPQVSGTITTVHFADGAMVRKGDVLFTIDPRPYEAAVARASADLAAAKARESYTAAEATRARRLLSQNAIARRDFDEKLNAARVAAAQRLGAEAAVGTAQLELEHTRIVAPVSGRVSRAEVTEGNVVAAGAASPPLTTLVSVDKMYASFEVDEPSFLAFVNPARNGQGKPPSVEMGLSNEQGFPRNGQLDSVDNQVDTSSGTIRLRAIFTNADDTLVPGLYARIRLGRGDSRDAVLIHETAIGTDQDKRFVLVVDENNKAVYRQVTPGAIQEGLRVIEAGLNPGERIVVNGLQRVRPGDPVAPRNVASAGKALADATSAQPQAAPTADTAL